MASTLTGKALILVHCVISLLHFFQSFIPQNLGVASKVTTLAMESTFFFSDHLLRLQRGNYSRQKNTTVDVGYHYKNSLSLGMICVDGLINPIESVTNILTANVSGFPAYDLWSLGCILYHLLFGSTLCNVDSKQMNSLLSVFIYH